jgi:YVTN family beta-propeller protein
MKILLMRMSLIELQCKRGGTLTYTRLALARCLAVVLVLCPSIVLADVCAFVADPWSGKVLVVDTATNVTTGTIPLANSGAIAAQDGLLYLIGAGGLNVVEAASGAIVNTVPIPAKVYRGGLAVSPDGHSVFTAGETCGDQDCQGSLVVIDVTARQTTETPLPGLPIGVAVTPDGRFVYVANNQISCSDACSDKVSVIDTATREVTNNIDVPQGVDSLAIGPVADISDDDVTRAYVNSLGTVSVIDTDTQRVIKTFRVGAGAWNSPAQAVAFQTDAQVLVVTTTCDRETCDGRLAAVDSFYNTLSALIPVGGSERDAPRSVAIVPGNETVYVTSGYAIWALDAYTFDVRAGIPVAGFADGIAFASMSGRCEAPAACVGDCNGDGQVTIDELLLGVDLALGGQSGTCSKMDMNDDGRITVQELVKAVDVALHGCGG